MQVKIVVRPLLILSCLVFLGVVPQNGHARPSPSNGKFNEKFQSRIAGLNPNMQMLLKNPQRLALIYEQILAKVRENYDTSTRTVSGHFPGLLFRSIESMQGMKPIGRLYTKFGKYAMYECSAGNQVFIAPTGEYRIKQMDYRTGRRKVVHSGKLGEGALKDLGLLPDGQPPSEEVVQKQINAVLEDVKAETRKTALAGFAFPALLKSNVKITGKDFRIGPFKVHVKGDSLVMVCPVGVIAGIDTSNLRSKNTINFNVFESGWTQGNYHRHKKIYSGKVSVNWSQLDRLAQALMSSGQ